MPLLRRHVLTHHGCLPLNECLTPSCDQVKYGGPGPQKRGDDVTGQELQTMEVEFYFLPDLHRCCWAPQSSCMEQRVWDSWDSLGKRSCTAWVSCPERVVWTPTHLFRTNCTDCFAKLSPCPLTWKPECRKYKVNYIFFITKQACWIYFQILTVASVHWRRNRQQCFQRLNLLSWFSSGRDFSLCFDIRFCIRFRCGLPTTSSHRLQLEAST